MKAAAPVLRSRAAPLLLTGVFMLLLFGIGAMAISGFAARYSIISLLVLGSLLGMAGGGQTFVIILGGIDLSVPYMIDVADVVGGQLHGDGWPFWGIVTLLIGIAIVVGSFNGYVSSRFQVHPLIVTLGTGFAIQGGVLLWSGGLSTGSAPSWLASAVSVGSTSGFLPVPPVLLVWAVVAVVLIVTLRRTTFGREVYALGSNPTAARLALVRPNLIWASAFTVSTLCATVVGLLLLGFTGSVYGDVGSNYLFLSIGAVVVGGTSLLGGSGGYAGTIMGALILTELQTILIGLGLSEAALETVLGALVIAVVAVTGRQSSLGSRI